MKTKTSVAAIRLVREDEEQFAAALKEVSEALLAKSPELRAAISLLIEDYAEWELIPEIYSERYLDSDSSATRLRHTDGIIIGLLAQYVEMPSLHSKPQKIRFGFLERLKLKRAIKINRALNIYKSLPPR